MAILFQTNDLITRINRNKIYRVHGVEIEHGNDWHDRVEEYYYAYIEEVDSKIIRREIIGFLPVDGELTVYYRGIE